MYYLIQETLTEVTKAAIKNSHSQYVALLTSEEWAAEKDGFDMGIDIEFDLQGISTTKAEVNYDSLTGSFCIPDRANISGPELTFSFALDEKGIVFIDDSGAALALLRQIQRTKKWRLPSLERFLYDFVEQIIKQDRNLLEQYDHELDTIETAIEQDSDTVTIARVNDIRGEIRDLRIHYEQLLDFGQELEENENNFFQHDNLRYFRLFNSRIERLRDESIAVSDHTIQIRDTYKSQLDIKQNRIMTVLTIVTTIFMPLTVIAGWYGMNFKYMPELESRLGYPIIIIISILIIVLSLFYFKKKKWL